MKAILILAIILLILTLGGFFEVRAEVAPRTYGVSHKFFCTEEIATRMAHVANDGDLDGADLISKDALKAGKCFKYPEARNHPILEVLYGPFYFQGIGYGYVVRVFGGWYTWAWPGVNSNLPKDGGKLP